MEYEFRILINGVVAADGWTSNRDYMDIRFIQLREVNPHAIIAMEISPWYWEYREDKEKWIATCPGCDYSICPVITPRKNDMLGV